MEWSKLRSHLKYELSTSGLASYPLSKLPVRLADLEINGPTIYGYPPLQEQLARKSGVTPECVVASQGTSMANHLAMAALVEPGEEVLVESPTYELLLSTASYLGAEIRRFPRRRENGFRVDPIDVAAATGPHTKLIVLTNLNNPTSVRIDDETLAAIGEIAARSNANVLVDEVYLDSLFDPKVRSVFHLGPNFVTTNSLTKVYGLSGIRCGWILARPELAEKMWRLNDLFASTPAHPAELLSVVALEHLGPIAEHAKARLSANRALLNAFLESRDDLEAVRTPAGTTSFPRLKSGRADELCALLRERYETSVVPGRFFEMPEHFRIGIGGDTGMLGEGLDRVGRALDELDGS
jgi:aspartate/methionine/tyrosine aminotransferase